MNPNEYATMYEVEDTHWWYRSLREELRRRLQNLPGNPRILDIGCGTGENMAALGFQTGIDFAPQAIAYCRTRGLTRTVVASATALPFADASFDAAVSCDVLCQRSIAHKPELLDETARVVAPGGLFVCNVPAHQWLFSSHDRHVNNDKRFTRNEVRDLFQRSGFDPIEIRYWNSLLFPATAAVRMWRRLKQPEASDLTTHSSTRANDAFTGILATERRLATLVPMPIGLSILAVGRRV